METLMHTYFRATSNHKTNTRTKLSKHSQCNYVWKKTPEKYNISHPCMRFTSRKNDLQIKISIFLEICQLFYKDGVRRRSAILPTQQVHTRSVIVCECHERGRNATRSCPSHPLYCSLREGEEGNETKMYK